MTVSHFRAQVWAVVLIWGIALVTSSFQSAFANITPDGDTVYCPLQKRFVERSEPTSTVSLSTTEYCASPRDTQEFTSNLLRTVGSILISDQHDVDSLFFAYKANGERAFRGVSGSPEDPRTPATSGDQSKNATTASSSEMAPVALVTAYFESASSVLPVHIPAHLTVDAHTSTAHYISDPQRGPPAN